MMLPAKVKRWCTWKGARTKGNRAVWRGAAVLPERALSGRRFSSIWRGQSHVKIFSDWTTSFSTYVGCGAVYVAGAVLFVCRCSRESISFRSDGGENWSEAANCCRLRRQWRDREPAAQRDIWNRFNDLSREISIRVPLTRWTTRASGSFCLPPPLLLLLGRKAHSNSDLLILSPSI